jgi:hypothetical protein
MMSGLEINTTFVSYIKTSMYLTGMSREELYAEAYKDLIAISTHMNMFIDKVCKKATMRVILIYCFLQLLMESIRAENIFKIICL